jgi:hypothetical protein
MFGIKKTNRGRIFKKGAVGMERKTSFAPARGPAIRTPFSSVDPFNLIQAIGADKMCRPFELSLAVEAIGGIEKMDRISANRT